MHRKEGEGGGLYQLEAASRATFGGGERALLSFSTLDFCQINTSYKLLPPIFWKQFVPLAMFSIGSTE